jgi:hypothetical protein
VRSKCGLVLPGPVQDGVLTLSVLIKQMALIGPTQCETEWLVLLASFDTKYETLIADRSDVKKEIDLV